MPCVESDMQKHGNCANLSLLILFFVLFFLVLIFKPIAEWQKLREGPSPKSALYWTVLGSAEQVVQVIQVGQAVRAVRMISLDELHSENIWFSWFKPSNFLEKLRCHPCDKRMNGGQTESGK